MKTRLRTATALLALCIAALPLLAAEPAAAPGAPVALTAPAAGLDVFRYCLEMCNPAFEGRLTGSPGYAKAARWAADEMKKMGLRPLFGADGYLQPYASPCTRVDDASLDIFPESGGAPRRLEPFRDFLPLLFSGSGQAEGGAVFAGWGISAPEIGYDDFAGFDVRGKFVLCFRGTPDPADTRFETHDQHRNRIRNIREKGALGLVYIYETPQANPNGEVVEGFPSVEISEAAANSLLAAQGIDTAYLRAALKENRRPMSFPLPFRIKLSVKAEHFPRATGYNVGGYLPGTDPEKAGGLILVGGHFDGCGSFAGKAFPGADDNASGSASVLEAARRLLAAGVKTKRGIAFVLFGGEEKGLEGSRFYAEHTPAPFSTAAMINMDMTGEGAGAWCAYAPDSARLRASIDRTVAATGVPTAGYRVLKHVGVRGSDFAPFFEKGIPVVNYASDGPHLHYHQTGDDMRRVNPLIMEDIGRLAATTAFWLAQESFPLPDASPATRP